MRPAWLSESNSARDNDSCDYFGKVTQNSSIESMINTARGHFTTSPTSQAATTKAKPIDFSPSNGHVTGSIALSDHMDSFPLIPLHIIPQLNADDLRKCEGGVSELLSTLTNSEEDIQLSKYAARELSLIHRHLEEHRARERVFRLLSGDLSSELTTMEPRHTPRRNSTSNDEKTYRKIISIRSQANSSKSDLEISKLGPSQKTNSPRPCELGETPRVATESTTPNTNPLNNNQSKLPDLCKKPATGIVSTHLQPKKALPLFAMTSFVISGPGKRRRKLKRSKPQETEEMKKAKLDKEKEQRRQTALQRLEARQQLQKKKHEENQQKHSNSTSSTSFINDSAPFDLQKTNLSDTDTDVSDVSNCSENEGEAEKQIQELIPNPVTEQDNDQESSDEGGFFDENAHDDNNNCITDDDLSLQENEKASIEREEIISNENTCGFPLNTSSTLPNKQNISIFDLEHFEPTEESIKSPKLNTPVILEDTSNELRVKSRNSTPQSSLKKDEVKHPDHKIDVMASKSIRSMSFCPSTSQERSIISSTSSISWSPSTDLSSDIIQRLHEGKGNLIQSITKHLTNTLENSISQLSFSDRVKDQNGQSIDSHSTVETKSSPIQLHNLSLLSSRETVCKTFEHEAENIQEKCSSRLGSRSPETTGIKFLTTSDTTKLESTLIPANAKKKNNTTKSSQRRQKIISSTSTSAISINRIPSKDVKDYTGVISNFFNIMTSFYEQFQHNNNPLGSRDTLHLQNGDNPMRIQMKLYESWQSIMYDYATVFCTTNSNQVNSVTKNTSTGHIYSSQATSFTAHYRINSTNRTEVFDIVVEALEKIPDWEEHPNGLGLKTTWNLLWTWSKPRVERKTLLIWQKVNHFHGAKALTRKDQLKKNIYRYLAMGNKMKQFFDIVPQTFLLPQEYVAFVQAFRDRDLELLNSSCTSADSTITIADNANSAEENRSGTNCKQKQNIWIMKPVALSRGRGISLFHDLSQVVYGEQVVVQQYIEKPLLLDGYKFDLRLYVLVTSFNPLEAFFYEEGFVRLCTHRYTEDTNQIDNLFIHLTNSSIQKLNEDASIPK
jgi:hypothetical protein